MGRFHRIRALRQIGNHDAVAADGFLAVVRLAQHGVAPGEALVRAGHAIAGPAAFGKFALIAQCLEYRVVEFDRRIAVFRADSDVSDFGHEISSLKLRAKPLPSSGTKQELSFGPLSCFDRLSGDG